MIIGRDLIRSLGIDINGADMNIQLKVLRVNRLQKNRWHGQQVCDAMKQTFKNEPILKPSQESPLVLILKKETSYTHY